MSFSLYNRFRQIEKVRVDKDATSDYLGAASSSGALRTSSPLSYTDGGDYVTLGFTASSVKLDDLGTPDDNTDLDFSTTLHGLVPKGTNAGDFLKDDGTWATPSTGADVKVGIDSGATAGYLGALISDGVLRFTTNEFTLADGGDFVTLSLADHATARTALGLAIGTDVQAYDATIVVDADFGSAGLCATDGAGTYSIVADASANWNTAFGWGDHSGQGYVAAHAILDGSVHNDSVADVVTRGSIIYCNATPKWDELVVGAANTFLGSDGTDASYRTAAQVLASLSGAAGAAFAWNSQNLTGIGTIACGNTTVTGTLTATSTVTVPTALTGVIRADSGVLSVDTDVTDIVSAASTTAQGKIEIATGAETNTGTDATRAVSPDALDDWTGSAQVTTVGTLSAGDVTAQVSAASTTAAGKAEIATVAEINTGTDTGRVVSPDTLAGSYAGTKTVTIKVIADDTALTTGDAKTHWTVPIELNGMDLISVGAHVYTNSSSGTPTFQIHNLTDTSDMLSTVITIDANEPDSATAATPAVIDGTEDDVVTGDVLRFDCDVAGTGSKGMEIRMGFRLP